MKVQITFGVAGGKRLIACAVATLPQLVQALQSGRILLIGGTTVSAVSEELGYGPLWVSGRIDASGTRTAGLDKHTAPHTLLITKSHPENADSAVEGIINSLGPGDLIVCGANVLLDAEEGGYAAALALAAPRGGARGLALQSADTGGAAVVIACGLEKYVPGSLDDIVAAADRDNTELSMGAAISLLPLRGQVVTEKESLELLFGVSATAIAGGGVLGGEGCRVFALSGPDNNVLTAMNYARSLVGSVTSGAAESMPPCQPPCSHCGRHVGCVYKKYTGF